MGYHLVDLDDLDQWDDRPTDIHSLSVATGYDYQNSKSSTYSLERCTSKPPDRTYVVEPDQVLFVDPESPQRAFNPDTADTATRILAIAPSVDDARPYDSDDA